MFTGDYNYFDYKYNIPGYSGQDYGGMAQYLYLAISLIILIATLVPLRKTPHEKVKKIIGFLGIFLIVFYFAKTSWESYYDIKLSGAFNYHLLPFDTCSLIMPAAVLAGFGKGTIQRLAEGWVATGGIIGGFATMLYLNAFNYYPFLSFGATYSMIWHLLMVFMGVLIFVTARPPIKYTIVLDGFLLHLIMSVIVIPIDYLFDFDFMLYKDLGGVPIFEGVAARFNESGLWFLNPLMMLILYFIFFSIAYLIAAGIKNRKRVKTPIEQEEKPLTD